MVSGPHRIGTSAQEDQAVIVLESPAEIEAAFAPGAGMVASSLRHEGAELLGQRGGVANYARTGSTMGIPLLHPWANRPLLHPWANRLAGLRYAVGGIEVELDPQRSPIRLDEHGFPSTGSPPPAPTGRSRR